MMTLTQNYSAVVPASAFAQFVAVGGTSPYAYSVVPGGTGGVIDPDTGFYTAPPVMTAYPAASLYDTIVATDALSATATSQILVATPLFLFCDILQTQLNLPNDHCYIWNQKVFQPSDSNLYLIVSMPAPKPFGNNLKPSADGSVVNQYVSMYARVNIDIISRGPAARDQKELVILALNSIYSQQQQEANGFYIGKIPVSGGFVNLSQIDGAAIPYRYQISFAMQYSVSLAQSVPYFETFNPSDVITDS